MKQSVDSRSGGSRNPGIDILKIVSMISVIVLHYNNRGIGQAFAYVPLFSTKSYVLFFLQSFCICAVNVFVLITGYFMCNAQKADLKKPARLLFQVVVFRELLVIIKMLLRGNVVTFAAVWRYILPQSWFAVLYACLYVVTPYINRLMNTLSTKAQKKMLLACFMMFSIWPWGVDAIETFSGVSFNGLSTIGMYGSQSGYTIVNFIFMYMIGAYLRKTEKAFELWKCITALLGCCGFTFVFSYFLETCGYSTGLAFSYCNPVVILTAIFTFLLFAGLKIRYHPIINSVSKATFSVYLLNTTLITDCFHAKEYVLGNGFRMLGHLALTCIVICAVSWGAQMIFDMVTRPLFKLIDSHLPFDTIIGIE